MRMLFVTLAHIHLASSQAVQHRAVNSLLMLNLPLHLSGQPGFHLTSSPLYLHIACFLVGRMESEEFEEERIP